MITEIIGIFGSIFVMASMFFNTKTDKGALWLRRINNIGSIFFIVYGIRLNAISVVALNVIVVFVNIYHSIKLRKS